jgi:hypothetical protein
VNERIAYVLALLFAVACTAISVWLIGHGIDGLYENQYAPHTSHSTR